MVEHLELFGSPKVSINLQIILIHSLFSFRHFLKTLWLLNWVETNWLRNKLYTKVKRISWYQWNTDSRLLFSSQNQLSWLTLSLYITLGYLFTTELNTLSTLSFEFSVLPAIFVNKTHPAQFAVSRKRSPFVQLCNFWGSKVVVIRFTQKFLIGFAHSSL